MWFKMLHLISKLLETDDNFSLSSSLKNNAHFCIRFDTYKILLKLYKYFLHCDESFDEP